MLNRIARRARAAHAGHRAPAPASPARRAVILDLDNIGEPAAGYAHPVLSALLEAAGPYDVAIASGRDVPFAAYADACRELGVQVFQAPAVRNGADQALLASAAALAQLGVREFVVMSGDHAFAALPGTVHVVMPANRAVSASLTRRAASLAAVAVPRPAPRPTRRRRRPAHRRAAAAAALAAA